MKRYILKAMKTNKVNVSLPCKPIMCKIKVKITFHSNIAKLQSKKLNNAFKAEVKFNKLKMKINRLRTKAQTCVRLF